VESAVVDGTPQPNDTSVSTSTSNTDSAITSNGSVGSSIDNTEEGGAVSTSTNDMSSFDTSNSSSNVDKPKFFFTPVNRFGAVKGHQLEDKGRCIH